MAREAASRPGCGWKGRRFLVNTGTPWTAGTANPAPIGTRRASDGLVESPLRADAHGGFGGAGRGNGPLATAAPRPPARPYGAETRSPQATWTWADSWINPPIRSSRATRMLAGGTGREWLPAVVAGPVSGAAGAGCSGPRRLTAPPPAVDYDQHPIQQLTTDVPIIAPRPRSRVASARAFASSGRLQKRRSHRRCR